jgi:hypothetical protein
MHSVCEILSRIGLVLVSKILGCHFAQLALEMLLSYHFKASSFFLEKVAVVEDF